MAISQASSRESVWWLGFVPGVVTSKASQGALLGSGEQQAGEDQTCIALPWKGTSQVPPGATPGCPDPTQVYQSLAKNSQGGLGADYTSVCLF